MYPSTLGFNVLRAWRGLRENPGPGTVGGSREETQSWGRSVLKWAWGVGGLQASPSSWAWGRERYRMERVLKDHAVLSRQDKNP